MSSNSRFLGFMILVWFPSVLTVGCWLARYWTFEFTNPFQVLLLMYVLMLIWFAPLIYICFFKKAAK